MIKVVLCGLVIGSLMFCSIQLGYIAASIRRIDRTLAVWSMHSMMPKLFDDFMKANMEEGENDNR